MRISAAGRLGIALALAGLVACGAASYWFATRSAVPLDMPISFIRGMHITREFEINLPQRYSMDIVLDDRSLPSYAECPIFSVLQTQWTVTQEGRVIARSDSDYNSTGETRLGTSLGWFDADNGRYRLDLTEMSDASCLNSAKPRLRIATLHWGYMDYRDWYAIVVWFSLLVAGSGFVLFKLTMAARARENRPSIYPASSPGGIAPRGWSVLESLRSRRWSGFELGASESGSRIPVPSLGGDPVRNLPTVGLALPLFLFVILAPWMLIESSHRHPVGLMVRLLGPRTILTKEWGEGLVVRIDAGNRWYLNSREVAPSQLESALWSELGRQPPRIAYIDGDSNIGFGEVARAIDIIRGQDAKVILLTPGSIRSLTGESKH
jgi:biopolymer transport protein ExbD